MFSLKTRSNLGSSLQIWVVCLAVLFGLSIINPASAQISAGGIPPSFAKTLTAAVPTIAMPAIDVAAYLAEDEAAGKDVAYRFGAPIEVSYNLNNSGTWSDLPEGGRVWRLRIESSGAYSIGLLYDQWYIPEGGGLFIYNDDRSQVIGAFTSFNNWTDGTNITQPVAGDATILEYYEPASVTGQGVLAISRVVHAYRNLFGRGNLDNYGDSGSCNNNVNCPEGADWQREKRGVAMILSGGSRICSGSLINNTNNDYTPYFLTANHCLGGETSWVFMFNYESPGCTNQNGPTNQTVANATRRATDTPSDFALLQLSSSIPLTYNPYFNGWNRVDSAGTNSVGIHHPSGDIKKISFDDNPPVSDRYLGSSGVANSHWKIVRWDDGTTEGGSSGSPLFDQNHRIIGQLHGGYASCTSLTPDWYGKFQMSWAYGSSPSTRLRDWLDPGNLDVMVLDGVDPNVTSRIGGTVTGQNALPLAGVRVGVIGGTRETYTDSSGNYLLGMVEGTYNIEFTKFGYERVVVNNVVVMENDTTWVDATLNAVPEGVLRGTVATQIGQGIQGARVYIRNTPYDTLTTDENGQFTLELPATDFEVYAVVVFNADPVVVLETDTVLTIAAGDTTFATIEMFVEFIEPTDPDAYGYRGYDRYDRDLPADYEWVELDPLYGNEGIEFFYPHQDSAIFIPTPFPICFYGNESDTLTVNANGWMLPGVHHEPGNRNFPIPYNAPTDPPGIIAPFWGDIRTGLGEQQFMEYDSAGGRWILEFINQRLASSMSHYQNWEVQFLDPAFYPTLTGDCEFQFVYGQMDGILGSTIGIEAPSEQTGIQIAYNGGLNSTCWPIEDGAAIRFTTGHAAETGSIAGTLILHPSTGNITGAVVRTAGVEMSPNMAGAFSSDAIPACAASALLALPGYEQTRLNHVRVAADSTTNLTIEAWRLDPPRELGSSTAGDVVGLWWRVPLSVEDAPNPDVRYTVYRDGELISEMVADTFFVDDNFPVTESAVYTVVAHYRWGVSLPSEGLTVSLATDDIQTALPTVFALKANYPNPFNPTTTIAFDLPQRSQVRLTVFDVTGREVATLTDQTMSAGSYSVVWNAAGLPSGMYMTVMEAGDHRFVQKMLLLK